MVDYTRLHAATVTVLSRHSSRGCSCWGRRRLQFRVRSMSSLSRLMQNNCFLARVVRTVSVNQTCSMRCFLWIRAEVTAAMKHQGKSKPYAKDCFGWNLIGASRRLWLKFQNQITASWDYQQFWAYFCRGRQCNVVWVQQLQPCVCVCVCVCVLFGLCTHTNQMISTEWVTAD